MVQHFAYKEMVSLQLSERSMFRYPPYYRLIVLILRSRNEEALQEMSALYAEKLRARLGERVLGPVTPPISGTDASYQEDRLEDRDIRRDRSAS